MHGDCRGVDFIDDAVIHEICFVPTHDEDNAFDNGFDSGDPALYLIECLTGCQIEYNDRGSRIAVIDWSEASIELLPCGIPDKKTESPIAELEIDGPAGTPDGSGKAAKSGRCEKLFVSVDDQRSFGVFRGLHGFSRVVKNNAVRLRSCIHRISQLPKRLPTPRMCTILCSQQINH
jgi:hypothetical protein